MSTKRKQRGRAETRQPLRLDFLAFPPPHPSNRATPTVFWIQYLAFVCHTMRFIFKSVGLCFMLSAQDSVSALF